MMAQMRAKTKWIMLVTATAFVGLMVFEWGMDLSGRSSSQLRGGELGKVNGEAVTYEEFTNVYRGLYERAQREQREPISAVQNRDLENLAWDQLVTEKLVQQELKRRGLRATAAEVRNAARFMPPPELYNNELFQTDGQFDLSRYHQYLSSTAVDPMLLVQLEAYYRDAIPRNKLAQQVMSGMYLTDGELWRMWRDITETASVRYLRLDPERLVPDDAAAVSDQEISAYYRSHRDEFKRGASAGVRIVTLSRAPTAADTALVRERAEAARAEIVGGADFAVIAERDSEDPGSASRGGELGPVQRGSLVDPIDDLVFSLPVGQVSEPVLSPYGFHLLRVDSRDGDEATARHILYRIAPSDASLDALYVRADSLERAGEREGIDAAAQRLGLSTSTADLLQDMPYLEPVGRVDEGLDWALWDAKPGDVSPVFETPTAFYILELVNRQPAGVLPLEEATPLIRSKLRREKKLEQARTLAGHVADDVRRGRSLEEAAASRGFALDEAEPFTRMDFVPGLGRANAAIGAAFGLQPGQVSGVVEAEGALFIIQSTGRQEADRAGWEEQKLFQRMRLMSNLEQDRWRQFVGALRESAQIVDQRDQVLRRNPDDQPAIPTQRGLF